MDTPDAQTLTGRGKLTVPTRMSSAVFRAKVAILTTRRAVQDNANRVQSWPSIETSVGWTQSAESRTPLWSEENNAEKSLQLGKVQNLRCALRHLDGMEMPAGGLFSFWKQIGRATRRRGYTYGRQLFEGCLYPAIGGGICQLSNSLYECALQAGMEIIERHPHTQVIPGSAAAVGRDATVAWNYMDLRFQAKVDLRIEARLTRNELTIRFLERTTDEHRTISATQEHFRTRPQSLRVIDVDKHSCVSCGEYGCFRHASAVKAHSCCGSAKRTAFVLNENWPEFRQLLADRHTTDDVLLIPLNGARWHIGRHNWDTSGYSTIGDAARETMVRALRSRRLGAYGARRLQADLDSAERLAHALGRQIPPDVTKVIVAQTLLPYIWRDHFLGGRSFDVVMTRLPLKVLHSRLDYALAKNPERAILAEFRAPRRLVEAESEALEVADRIITPHSEIAAMFGARAKLIPWSMPKSNRATRGSAIVFPGPTAARKGAYEVRAVARELDLEVILVGSELEGAEFWNGVRIRRSERGSHTLDGVAAVVQPALVEDRPRILLEAVGAGIPVIASPACGLGDLPGVITVPYGELLALREAVVAVLRSDLSSTMDTMVSDFKSG
jgi:hypothetical protein